MSTTKKIDSHLSRQPKRGFFPWGASNWTKAGSTVEEAALSLFQPDTLLPAQYIGTMKRKDHLEPEKRLMLAVLEDAVWCFQRCLLARDKRRKNLFSEAEEWVLQENGDWLFSFESICEVLGLNPKYVCEGLMRWKTTTLTARAKTRVYRLNRSQLYTAREGTRR